MSGAAWATAVLRSMRREFRLWTQNPREIFFCAIMPLAWMLIVWGLLGQGIMTRVPIGLVDEDQSSMSREVIRALSSAQALGLESFENSIAALNAMRQGGIYGVIVIPDNYMRHKLNGMGSPVILYTDENRFAVGGTFEATVSAVITGLRDDELVTQVMKTGTGEAGARRIVGLVHSDFYRLGNMGSSFLIFLSSTLLPGLVTIGATFAFISAILREIWNNSVHDWQLAANGSFAAALLGKLAPHFGFYCLVFLFYIALFSGYGGFAPAGSIAIWWLCGAATLAALAAMCILIAACAPTWRLALVIAVGYAAPALPFSGFSIPLDSMDAGVRFYANFIPLTWYIRGQSQQWNLGASLNEMGGTFLALGLLFIVPLLIGLPLFSRKFTAIAKKEQAQT